MFTPSRRYIVPRKALNRAGSLATHVAGSTPAQIQRQRWTGLNSPEGWQLPRACSVKRREQLSSGKKCREARGWRNNLNYRGFLGSWIQASDRRQ